MKKITLLTFLLIGSLVFSQELVTNGDFETGMATPWFGNAANVVDQGGNFLNEANVMTAVPGQPFQVNLSQNVDLINGVTYEMSFDAFTDSATGSRTIVAGLGQNAAPFSALVETLTITSTSQTFTFQFTINYGDGVGDRVIFDMAEETGFIFIDNVSVTEVMTTCNNGVQDGDETGVDCGGSVCEPCITLPGVPAPTPPARDAASVFSIFSNAYTNQPNVVFGAFNVGTQDITNIQVDSDDVTQVTLIQPDPQFLLVDWGTIVDNTSMTHFHMDYWIDTNLSTGLIANPAWSNHVGDSGETSSFGLTNPVSTFGDWVSIDVPLSTFDFGNNSNNQQRDALRQFVLTLAGADMGSRTIFLDNIYLHNNTTLSTNEFEIEQIQAFPNPTKGSWEINSINRTIESIEVFDILGKNVLSCLLYTSPSPRDRQKSRMPSSA